MSESKPEPVEALIQFRADAELRRRIDQMAAADDRSRASWLRRTLDQVVRMQKNERPSP
jgi:predicted transcriptional regulator